MKTGLITGFGINADLELAAAFELAGSQTLPVHLNELIEKPDLLNEFSILAFPGGFSFGDHIGSGTILAHIVRNHLREHIQRFLESGKLIIGICNGFQTLVKMGLLPNTKGDWSNQVSLIHNEGGTFIDAWVKLAVNSGNRSPWLSGLNDFDCPIRHGEGQFILSKDLGKSFPEELVAFRYYNNPNGSYDNIAGITDVSGQVLGMMPHPEAFIKSEQHPSRKKNTSNSGIEIFKNAVKYASKL